MRCMGQRRTIPRIRDRLTIPRARRVKKIFAIKARRDLRAHRDALLFLAKLTPRT